MKTAVVIITYNISSEVFMLQIEAIRKFCKDDFEIEVFDNSSDVEKAEGIRYHASILEISYCKTHANSLNGSDSHSFAANFSYGILKDKYSLFAYLDHDLLPIKDFSVEEILGDKIIAGVGQIKNGVKYFWPGAVMWDNTKIDNDLIDFSPDHEKNLDTGGGLHKIIDEYGEDVCIFFSEAYHQNDGFAGKKYNYYAMINGMFMHFVNSSNWNPIKNHDNRINSLLNIAREKIYAT